MTSGAENDRQRRHREKWMKEMLDGLDRIHGLLQGQNGALEALRVELARIGDAQGRSEPLEPQPQLMSTKAVAEYLGVATSTVRAMTAGPEGAPAVRIGRTYYFKRVDIDAMVERLKGHGDVGPRVSYRVRPIGAGIPATSDVPPKAWCPGSGAEPVRLGGTPGRGRCPECRDEPLINKNGRLRKHIAWGRF